MRWKAPIAAFAVVCLVGCTGSPRDGSPSSASPMFSPPTVSPTAPTPTTPAVPSDVPTTGPNLEYRGEKPPVEPVAALEHSAAGAKSFAEFFIKTIDWGEATMSGAYLRHYSASDCTTCLGIASDMDAARRAGHRYIGGRSQVTSTRPQARSFGQFVTTRSTSFEELDGRGQFVTGDPAYMKLVYLVDLQWQSAAWKVVKVSIEDMVAAA